MKESALGKRNIFEMIVSTSSQLFDYKHASATACDITTNQKKKKRKRKKKFLHMYLNVN